MSQASDIIAPEIARTLDGLFKERVRRSSSAVAYRNWEEPGGWKGLHLERCRESGRDVGRQDSKRIGLQPGDRVAIMLRNSVSWIVFDQAAMGLDLVTVPLYTSDRPDNIAYILQDSGAKLLVFENADQWASFAQVQDQLVGLKRVLCINPMPGPCDDARVKSVAAWLPKASAPAKHVNQDGAKLTSIIYTSGTTGKPKGVMLSHRNMLENATQHCSVSR
jgi:long-chain acyl-CoA synthetase